MITARQIRAARAMLGWSQDELAFKAGLSATTIRGLESQQMSPRGATERAIRKVIEIAGLEFTDQEGVRLALNEVKIISGADSCDIFYNDLLRVAKQGRGEIIGVFRSQDMLNQSYNVTQANLKWLKLLSDLTSVKCLMSENFVREADALPFDTRLVSKQQIGAVSYFVYGNKHAIILPENNRGIGFMIYDSMSLSEAYRSHFALLWEQAIMVQQVSLAINKRKTSKRLPLT